MLRKEGLIRKYKTWDMDTFKEVEGVESSTWSKEWKKDVPKYEPSANLRNMEYLDYHYFREGSGSTWDISSEEEKENLRKGG